MTEIGKRYRVYLDHNVLDSIIKGDQFGVKRLLEDEAFLPVYSDENLKEISKSQGFEQQFLEALDSVGAWYLVESLDHAFVPTGQAQIKEVRPSEAYASLMHTLAEALQGDGGLSRLLQKAYGGLRNTSHQEILAQGGDEVEELLRSACKNYESRDPLDPAKASYVTRMIEQAPMLFREAMQFIGAQLDEQIPDSMVQTFQRGSGISALELNNIEMPGVVLQVWEKLRESMPGVGCDLEEFFCLNQTPWCGDKCREPTIPEKVNAIYHTLNFVKYFRDTAMKEEKGLKRSFADMTHAGMATFCHLMITADKRMFKKATAAYEYLNTGPCVHLLKTDGFEEAGPWLTAAHEQV